jgi:hypothetical protein
MSGFYEPYAVFNPIPAWPSFLTPVFTNPGGGNGLFLQVVNVSGIAFHFHEASGLPDIIRLPIGAHPSIVENDPAIHAFAFSPHEVSIGTHESLSALLRNMVDDQRLLERPLVRLQLIEFCQREDRLRDALLQADGAMRAISSITAQHWRDFRVITNAARSFIARRLSWLSERLRDYDQLSSVSFTSSAARPTLFIGEDVFGLLGPPANWISAAQVALERYLTPFGIPADQLQCKTKSPQPTSPAMSDTFEPIDVGQVARARWVLCGFGRASQAALRSREILSRRDIFVLPEADPDALERVASLAESRSQSHPCELVFVCDSDSRSINAASAAAPFATKSSPPSLAIIYRSDRSPLKDGLLPNRRTAEFQDRVIIVDSQVQVFKGRSRYTVGRLVRSYLDTISVRDNNHSRYLKQQDWSVFSLGSHPRGVNHAVSALEQAIVSSINPSIDTLASDDLHITIMSVGRPTAEIEESVQRSAVIGFRKASDQVNISWRQMSYSGHSAPVQIGLLAKGLNLDRPSGFSTSFFKSVERMLSLYQGEWSRQSSTETVTEYIVNIRGDSIRISAFAEADDDISDFGSVIRCVATKADRKDLYTRTYSEVVPILLLNELPYILESDNPLRDATHIYRVSSTRDTLRNEFADIVADYIRNELFSSPSSYGLYQPLQDLSRNTVIEDVDVVIQKAMRMSGFSVRFIGTLHLSVELDYGDKDVNSSDSYPGYFECIASPEGLELTTATADTSSFYE